MVIASFPITLVFLLALGLTTIPLAHAEDKPKKLFFVAGFESSAGGDDLGELVVDTVDKGDVEAGSGMHFYIGMLYKPASAFETRLTAGYQMDRSPTDTGTVFMDRYPIELTPVYCHNNHRFGLGLTYHTNIMLHGSDFNKPDVSFKDALGYSVEYGYKVAPFLYLGFRYVNLYYKIENTGLYLDGGQVVDASHFGINLYYQH